MARNYVVKFRVSKEEKEMLLQRAARQGYTTLGAYMRDISLQFDYYEKIDAIYSKLTGNT